MADEKDCNPDSAPSPAAVDSGTVDIFLLCYLPSPLFHAHWALFVPDTERPQCGTVLNVRGDPLHGFVHEFERGYIPSEDPEKPPTVLELGSIAERLVRLDGAASDGKDTEAYTQLERLALSIDAPGRSLGRGASKDVSPEFDCCGCGEFGHASHWLQELERALLIQLFSAQGRVRVEIRDCQWWVRQLVSSMIEQEMMSSDAQRVLEDAPQH